LLEKFVFAELVGPSATVAKLIAEAKAQQLRFFILLAARNGRQRKTQSLEA
jgi:hypothetical protein